MREYKEYRGFWFNGDTPRAVKDVIVDNRNKRVRLHIGDKETGRVWLEEHDVIGRVGRSIGSVNVPLIIEAGEIGGGEILTHCILAIQDTKTKKWLYRADNFKLPELKIVPQNLSVTTKAGKPYKYTHAVVRDNETQANFTSEQKALNYIAFMRGERMRVS